MWYTLVLTVVPETTMPINPLWKVGMSAVLDDLRDTHGIGTDADVEPRTSTSGVYWHLFGRLAPLGVGEILVSVNEESPPHEVVLTLKTDVLTEVDYGDILYKVARQMEGSYAVRWRLSATGDDD